MPRGALIGRIFGTDIYATASFVMLMVLLLVMYSSAVAAIAAIEVALIVSVLVHEFGHVFAVRKFTGGDSVVVLWGFGGLCLHEPTPVISKRIGISLMGPAFGFVLAGIFWLIQRFALPAAPHPAVDLFVGYMVWAGVFINVLNLLPVLPMDGGQATLALLERKRPRDKALLLTRRISVVTAAGAIAVAVNFFPGFNLLVMVLALFLVQNLIASRSGL